MIDLSGSASAGRRVLLYSNDTYGNGHIRQSLELASRLRRLGDVEAVLVVGSSPRPVALERPDGVDLVTLPSAVEEGATYRSQTLGVPLADLVRFRGDVITKVVESFGPDVMLVAEQPVGFEAELWPLFRRFVESRSRPRLVLGVRDVVDSADRVNDEWLRLDAWRVVDRMYDRVLVYGDASSLTTAAELRLDKRVGGRVRSVGYLSPSIPSSHGDQSEPRPIVLITDDDATSELILDAYASFLSSLGNPSAVRSLELRAGEAATAEAIARAAAVVAIADYPTVCEILAARVPALLIPRQAPSQEQALRADRLAASGRFETVAARDLDAHRLHQFVAATATHAPGDELLVNTHGLDAVAAEVTTLLSQPASFGPAPVEPAAEIRVVPGSSPHGFPRQAGHDVHRVGYLLRAFPDPSDGHILNELLGLEDAGVALEVLSLGEPEASDESAEATIGDARVAQLSAPVSVLEATSGSSLRVLFEALDRQAGPDGARQARTLLHRLPGPTGVRILDHALQVAEKVATHGLSHLHAHYMEEAAYTAFVAHVLTGLPFSVTVHGHDVFRHNVDREAFSEVASAAAAVIATSKAASDHIVNELLLGREARVEVVPSAAAATTAEPQGSTTSPRIGGFVLAVGALEEKKGFDVLVEACAQLLADGIDVGCAIVGDGPERSHLARRIRAAGIGDRVRLAGDLPHRQVLDLMQRAMVVAAPALTAPDGDRDSLPTVLLEAMRRGTPVISTPVGGIPELVDDGVDGILVPSRDAGALAAGLRLLLSERDTWQRLSEAAEVKMNQHFDNDAAIARLASLLGNAISVPAHSQR